MNQKAPDQRTATFRWHSKQELCDYFNIHYGFSRKLVEAYSGICPPSRMVTKLKGRRSSIPRMWSAWPWV